MFDRKRRRQLKLTFMNFLFPRRKYISVVRNSSFNQISISFNIQWCVVTFRQSELGRLNCSRKTKPMCAWPSIIETKRIVSLYLQLMVVDLARREPSSLTVVRRRAPSNGAGDVRPLAAPATLARRSDYLPIYYSGDNHESIISGFSSRWQRLPAPSSYSFVNMN